MENVDTIMGLPLEKALAILEKQSIIPAHIETTAPPKHPERQGTKRVVAVRDNGRTLVVASFKDSTPARV